MRRAVEVDHEKFNCAPSVALRMGNTCPLRPPRRALMRAGGSTSWDGIPSWPSRSL